MSNRHPASFAKRQREAAKRAKRVEKAEKRALRKADRGTTSQPGAPVELETETYDEQPVTEEAAQDVPSDGLVTPTRRPSARER